MNQNYQDGYYIPEFTIGSVLSRTFAMLMSQPLVFFGLMSLTLIPNLISVLAVDYDSLLTGGGNLNVGPLIITSLVSLFLSLIIQGAMAFAVFQTLTGDDASIAESLKRGFDRMLSLVLATILMGLCIGCGFVLLIVPGFILLVMLALTIPACTVEKLGPLASLNRSIELTKGYRWKVLGLILIYIGAAIAIDFVVTAVIGLFSFSPMASFYVNIFVSILPATFYSVMIGLIYFDLRSAYEGVDVGGLSNVFD